MSTPVQDPARVARRRREHERQAVIYGVLVAILLLVGLGALAVYTGAIDAPFARGFHDPNAVVETVTPPCLPQVKDQPDGALPVAYSDVHLRIFNASGTAGIAAANQDVLERRGFVVDLPLGDGPLIRHSELRFGTQGIVHAYTLAAQFPRMNLVLDARKDTSVDLWVGEEYDKPIDEDKVQVAAGTPLQNAEGCVPADKITPRPAPTPAKK